MAKYTFLLPAYKAKFLNEALQSIQNQTYTDFKVLISDDCSPEDLHTICLPYLEDKRFEYQRNKENIGGNNLTDHWNLLLSKTDSEYIILACDDDLYSPLFLEEIDKLSTKYPQTDIIRARVARIDPEGDIYQKDGVYEEFTNHLEFIADRYDEKDIWCIGNYVFKREPLITSGGFVKFPLAWCSDGATAIKMSKKGAANTHMILFSIRWSGISISSIQESGEKGVIQMKTKLNSILLFSDWLLNLLNGITHSSDALSSTTWEYLYRRFRFKIFYGTLPFIKFLSIKEKYRLHSFLQSRGFLYLSYYRYMFVKECLKTTFLPSKEQ